MSVAQICNILLVNNICRLKHCLVEFLQQRGYAIDPRVLKQSDQECMNQYHNECPYNNFIYTLQMIATKADPTLPSSNQAQTGPAMTFSVPILPVVEDVIKSNVPKRKTVNKKRKRKSKKEKEKEEKEAKEKQKQKAKEWKESESEGEESKEEEDEEEEQEEEQEEEEGNEKTKETKKQINTDEKEEKNEKESEQKDDDLALVLPDVDQNAVRLKKEHVLVLTLKEDQSMDGTIRIGTVRMLVAYVKLVGAKHIIIVSHNVMTHSAQRKLEEALQDVEIEQFRMCELLNDPTQHILVPKMQPLTKEEQEHFYQQYMVKPCHLPRCTREDAIVRRLNLKEGQVVKCFHPANPTHIFYYYVGAAK